MAACPEVSLYADVKQHEFRKKRLGEDEVAQIPGSLCGGCKEQQPASYNEALIERYTCQPRGDGARCAPAFNRC